MTEKDYNPNQKEKKAMRKAAAAQKVKKKVIKDIEGKGKAKVPEKIAEKEEKIAEKIEEKTEKAKEKTGNENDSKKDSKPKQPKESKPQAKPKTERKSQKKKEIVVINSYDLPISTKKSAGVCKFIKGKTIDNAIEELEKVILMRRAVPMKGELPHRKGKIMSGRFPKKTAKHFIVVLKGLAGNANMNNMDNPVIVEAVANIGSRPYGRFGRVRRKRTHLKISAKERKSVNQAKKKSKNKKIKSKGKK